MSGWAQPRRQLLERSKPSAAGRDLGVINRKYFEPATWEPLLGTEMGQGQYSKFVASMIERIHLKESSYDEIRSFIRLIAVRTFQGSPFLRIPQDGSQEIFREYSPPSALPGCLMTRDVCPEQGFLTPKSS